MKQSSPKIGLTQSLIKDITTRIIRRKPVTQVILYGSRARGDFKPTSDIDLAVVAPQWTSADLGNVRLDLEEEISTPLKFDLVLISSKMKESLRNNILKEGKVIYESTKN